MYERRGLQLATLEQELGKKLLFYFYVAKHSNDGINLSFDLHQKERNINTSLPPKMETLNKIIFKHKISFDFFFGFASITNFKVTSLHKCNVRPHLLDVCNASDVSQVHTVNMSGNRAYLHQTA